MAAAVVGARRGIKRGIERVQGPAGEVVNKRKVLAENYEGLRQRMRNNDPEVTEGQVRDALVKYRQMQEKNEETIAKSVIANTAGYTTGAALSGYVLESMRRALRKPRIRSPITDAI